MVAGLKDPFFSPTFPHITFMNCLCFGQGQRKLKMLLVCMMVEVGSIRHPILTILMYPRLGHMACLMVLICTVIRYDMIEVLTHLFVIISVINSLGWEGFLRKWSYISLDRGVSQVL